MDIHRGIPQNISVDMPRTLIQSPGELNDHHGGKTSGDGGDGCLGIGRWASFRARGRVVVTDG